MKLHDMLLKAKESQQFTIYLVNDYDENFPVARGTRTEMMHEDDPYDFFEALAYEIDFYDVKNDRIIIFVKNDDFNKRAAELYSDKKYVDSWDMLDPKTRPWLHGCETEVYTDKYIWKF